MVFEGIFLVCGFDCLWHRGRLDAEYFVEILLYRRRLLRYIVELCTFCHDQTVPQDKCNSQRKNLRFAVWFRIKEMRTELLITHSLTRGDD